MDWDRQNEVIIRWKRVSMLGAATALALVAVAGCGGSAAITTTDSATPSATEPTETVTVDALTSPVPSVERGGAAAQPDDATQPAPEPAAAAVVTDGQLGGETPLAAVEALIAAADASDPLGILAMLEPTERRFVGEVYSEFLEGATDEWPQFGGATTISMLGTELVPVGGLEVEQLSPYLAFVSAPEVEVWLGNPTDVVASFAWSSGPWTDDSRDNRAITIDDLYDIYGGYEDAPIGVVTVLIDGRWYVSLGRSALEGVRRDARLPASFPAEPPTIASAGAESPIDAAQRFAAAIESRSMHELAATLVPGEAQSIADYAAVMNDWLLFALSDLELTARIDDAAIVAEGDGRAIIEFGSLSLSAIGTFDDEFDTYSGRFDDVLRVDGPCATLDVGSDRSEACVPPTDPWSTWGALPLATGWQGFRLVTVEIDGRWAVSIYDTAALWLETYTHEPLYTAVFAPFWESPAPVTLINEKAKSLPLGDASGPVAMTIVADGWIGLARVVVGPDDSPMRIVDRPGLPEFCSIDVWNSDMVSADWSEEPEHYASTYEEDGCAEMVADGLPVPPGVEVTIVFYGEDGRLAPTTLTFGP